MNFSVAERQEELLVQMMLVVWLVAASGLVTTQVAAQCSPSPCGLNTQCDVNPAGAAVCRSAQVYSSPRVVY